MPYSNIIPAEKEHLYGIKRRPSPQNDCVIKPKPWEDETPPWIDEYERQREAFAHGITSNQNEPPTTPDHHP